MTFALALVFAFAGGLLLNLMPCVFPVLSVKVLSVVHHAGGNARSARRHGLLFAMGVVLSFWTVAGILVLLRSAGRQIGWGFQLQSPTVVALLALTLFVLALSMSGVFEVGSRLTRLGAAGSDRDADGLLSGLLAVVVATPCTAPFMGAAVGFALVQPAIAGAGVFTALGLGLAAPYVVLTSSPRLLRRLPRAGRWMETFRQLLAFPLYITVVWLVWVFARQVGVNAAAVLLLALTTAAFAAWVAGRGAAMQSRLPGAAGLLAAVTALAFAASAARMLPDVPGTLAVQLSNVDAMAEWLPFDPVSIDSLRASGRPVLVNFTAAWCLSCQVNDRFALRDPSVRRAARAADVALVRADWTSPDPVIADALATFGRSGVPLYVMYPAGVLAPPEILPVVLTPRIVTDAIGRAAAASTFAGEGS